MKSLALLACVTMMASPAWAADWRLLNLGKANKLRTVSFIDVSTLKTNGTVVRYWKDVRVNNWTKQDSLPWNRIVELVEVDCSERKHRTLSSKAFWDRDFTLDLNLTPWDYAVPDTNMDGELRRACSKKWGTETLDPDGIAKVLLKGMEARDALSERP